MIYNLENTDNEKINKWISAMRQFFTVANKIYINPYNNS